MVGLKDIVFVTILAIAASVLIGVLGILIDRNSEPEVTDKK
jgi:hypothetical protein